MCLKNISNLFNQHYKTGWINYSVVTQWGYKKWEKILDPSYGGFQGDSVKKKQHNSDLSIYYATFGRIGDELKMYVSIYLLVR